MPVEVQAARVECGSRHPPGAIKDERIGRPHGTHTVRRRLARATVTPHRRLCAPNFTLPENRSRNSPSLGSTRADFRRFPEWIPLPDGGRARASLLSSAEAGGSINSRIVSRIADSFLSKGHSAFSRRWQSRPIKDECGFARSPGHARHQRFEADGSSTPRPGWTLSSSNPVRFHARRSRPSLPGAPRSGDPPAASTAHLYAAAQTPPPPHPNPI